MRQARLSWLAARVVVGALIGATSIAAAQQAAKRLCYQPKWFNPTTEDCSNDCQFYINCPGSILCDLAPSGGGPDPIVVQSTPCAAYQDGEGSCASGCSGGAMVPGNPPMAIVVATQTCTTPCLRYFPVED